MVSFLILKMLCNCFNLLAVLIMLTIILNKTIKMKNSISKKRIKPFIKINQKIFLLVNFLHMHKNIGKMISIILTC